jgi:hypothetical protein
MNVTEATQLSEAHELVRRVSRWPSVRVESNGLEAAVHSNPGGARVARLNLLTGALTGFAVGDMESSLLATESRLRVTRDGVHLEVVDPDSREAGERLIRWLVDLQRFGPQLGEASP